MHRGPTHSLITITVLMIPFFIVYRKQAIPYYAALLSHILIGDFFTGGVELFWPMSQGWFGVLNIEVNGLTNVVAELGLFFVTLPIMYKLGDFQSLLRPHNKNWALIIPLGAVLGPLLAVGRGQENTLPTLLVVPSLFYIGLFAYSMVVEFRAGHNQDADACVFDKQTGARLFRASSSCASSIDHKANNRQNYPISITTPIKVIGSSPRIRVGGELTEYSKSTFSLYARWFFEVENVFAVTACCESEVLSIRSSFSIENCSSVWGSNPKINRVVPFYSRDVK